MQIAILSKNYGSQTINTESFSARLAATNSTIFKIIEHIFDEWYNYNTQPGAPMAKDIKGMYNGEADQPAIYSKKGAIRQGIENFIEYILEDPKQVVTTKDILKMDIEAAFS